MRFISIVTFAVIFGYASVVHCADPTTVQPDTTTTVEQLCTSHNKDCGTCLQSAKCLWCNSKDSGSQCVPYPTGDIIPRSNTCPLKDARWGVCWLNYQALLISMGVIAGVILLSITCCCVYCCCCRSKAKKHARFMQEEARHDRERDEMESRHADRRKERQSKYDEIRRKYGLTKEDGYKRFDNE